MKTKQEVIDFLESKLGTKVPCKGNPGLSGQCVTLVKALLEFLGAPDPYKARGHAKSCITAYLKEGIAEPGAGLISVFSNKDMAGGYGHIWVNAGEGNGTYYESNGVKPLTVTKGKTYPYDSVCNLDKYLKESMKTYNEEEMSKVRLERDANWNSFKEAENKLKDLQQSFSEYKNTTNLEIVHLNDLASHRLKEIAALETEINGLVEQQNEAMEQIEILKGQISSHKCELPTSDINTYSFGQLLIAMGRKFLEK